jgi:hypothetical protein
MTSRAVLDMPISASVRLPATGICSPFGSVTNPSKPKSEASDDAMSEMGWAY